MEVRSAMDAVVGKADDAVMPSVTADGTPDGNGNDGTGGTTKSLGKGGTAGTDGTGSVGMAGTEGIGAVTVSWERTTPLTSTVAMTSTATVNVLPDGACRR